MYLKSPEGAALGEIDFSLFRSRLLALPGISKSLLAISQGNTSWAVIVAKMCRDSLSFNFDSKSVKLTVDMHGRLQNAQSNPKYEGQKISECSSHDAPDAQPKRIMDLDGEPSSEISTSRMGVHDGVETTLTPVDFSTLHELNWGANKKNWDEILTESKISVDEIIAACDIWEPRLPMQITPDRDSMKHMFPSDGECMETICKLGTQTPGFAIASRSWASFLPDIGILQRPPDHVCDILTVAKGDDLDVPQANISLWVIVSGSSEQVIQMQIQYLFILGRTIKHQLSKKIREASNLAIRCMLHSTDEEDNVRIEHTLRGLGVQVTQGFLSSVFHENGSFDDTRQGVALLLLSQGSTIKTCAGNQLSVKLSAKQAQTLLEVKSMKVSYVSSAPGTGKTLCGLALYRDFGKERSIYICPSEPLRNYLRYNGCVATLVQNDEELYHQIKCGAFENKVCVIIDESHHLRCSKACLEELFVLMKRHRMRLFVFADNAYQSFDRENQQQIQTYIYELSKKVLGHPPYEPIFTEIYRNTRKVVSFLQHAIADSDSDNDDVLDITCGNAYEGEGIQCIAMENILDTHSDNGLVQYLKPLLDTTYQVTDIAVLLDSSYTDNIDAIRHILQRHLPRVNTHSSTKFPREGITVDRVERFAGLDATLCIFLLSVGRAITRDASIENPRYRVYLASRATQKAVFVVPRIAAGVVKHMKFDHFLVSFFL